MLRANCSPSPALLPPRSRCHWTSVVTEPFRCQFLYRVRVPSVPASRSFVSLHHSLLVCACARLLSPLMISDLCSGQTHSCTPTRNWIRAQATVSVACLQSARGIPVCSVRAALLPQTPCLFFLRQTEFAYNMVCDRWHLRRAYKRAKAARNGQTPTEPCAVCARPLTQPPHPACRWRRIRKDAQRVVRMSIRCRRWCMHRTDLGAANVHGMGAFAR